MSVGIGWGNVERLGPGHYKVDLRPGLFTLRAVTGLEKLVFEVLYVLFTTMNVIPGTTNVGSFMNTYLGGLVTDPQGGMAKTKQALTLEIIRVQDQIRSRQETEAIPDEERLESIAIDEIEVDTVNLGVNIKIAIVNALGQAAFLQVPQTLQA